METDDFNTTYWPVCVDEYDFIAEGMAEFGEWKRFGELEVKAERCAGNGRKVYFRLRRRLTKGASVVL